MLRRISARVGWAVLSVLAALALAVLNSRWGVEGDRRSEYLSCIAHGLCFGRLEPDRNRSAFSIAG